MSRRGVALALLGFAVVGGALSWGGVVIWAEQWLRALALAAIVVLAWSMRARAWVTGPHASVALPAALLVAWAFAQAAPLPRFLVATLSPRTSALQAEAVPADGAVGLPALLLARARVEGVRLEPGAGTWSVTPDRGSPAVRSSLSVAPAATQGAALSWATAIMFFVVAAVLGRDPVARWWLLWTAAAAGGIVGATAVLQRAFGAGILPWLGESPQGSNLVGPFVNPNHTAAFAIMGALPALGLAQAILAQPDGRLTVRGIRVALTDRSWAVPRLTVLGLLGILALAALALSGSRGGWLSFAVGLAALVPARRVRAMLPAAVLAAAGLGVAVGLATWVGSPASDAPAPFSVGTRDPSLSMRFDIWRGTLSMIGDHPWTGTGLGTFRWAYASYERPGEWLITQQAHNDYLQLAAETGLVGAALALWGLVAFGRRVLRRALSRAGGRPTTVAAAAAVLAGLVHAVVDFPLQMPAVALLFSILAGVVASAAEDQAPEAPETTT